MSGARRLMRPSAVALATVLLTLAAGPAPARAGAGRPRPSTGTLSVAPPATVAVAILGARCGDGPSAVCDSGLGSQANLEERQGEDVEAEFAIDRAPPPPSSCRIAGTCEALAALEARTRRHPYLLTVHLRF